MDHTQMVLKNQDYSPHSNAFKLQNLENICQKKGIPCIWLQSGLCQIFQSVLFYYSINGPIKEVYCNTNPGFDGVFEE